MDDSNNNISLEQSRFTSQREQNLFNLVELSINSLVKTIEVLAKHDNKPLDSISTVLGLPFSPQLSNPSPFMPPIIGSSGGNSSGNPSFPNPFSGMAKEDKELMSQMLKIAPEMQKHMEKTEEERKKENEEWKNKVFKKNEE